MEPAETTMKLPRQPQPVAIVMHGDPVDIEFWYRTLKPVIERAGDLFTRGVQANMFKIYPRAVND